MMQGRPNETVRFSRGFTVIELLVTLGVIAVVLSILLPVLAATRDRGRVIQSLAGHKQIVSIVESFGIDRNGRHPYIYLKRTGNYARPYYEMSDTDRPGYVPAKMSSQAKYWPTIFKETFPGLVQLVYPNRWEQLQEQDTQIGLIGGSFVASSTMFARPSFFGPNLPNANQQYFGPTRSSQVAFPSRKVFFEDLASWGLVRTQNDVHAATYGFADGSAAVLTQDEFSGQWVERAAAWRDAPGHTTLNGLQGIDR